MRCPGPPLRARTKTDVLPLVSPYTDELLYSVLARQQMRLGVTDSRSMLQLTFGNGSRIASVHLQGGLHALEWLSGGDSNTVLVKLTLFPYFASLLSSTRRDALATRLSNGRGEALFFSLGMAASRIVRRPWLRLCPRCSEQDRTERGETYWRRVHQLPGIEFCPWHSASLVETVVPSLPPGRHRFVAARFDMLASAAAIVADGELGCHVALAKASLALLNGEIPDLHRQAVSGLRRYGESEKSAKSMADTLGRRLLQAFGSSFMERCGALHGLFGTGGWLAAPLRDPGRLRHPLRHLLLLVLFDRSPAPPSPPACRWRCPNRLAPHYRRRMVARAASATGLPRGVYRFECRCGMVFTSNGEEAEGFLRIRRVTEWGGEYVKRAEALAAQGYGVRAIGRELDVDPKTVRRLLRPLNVLHTGCSDSCRDQMRAAWSGAVNSASGSISTARRAQPGLYAKLYRADRQWLREVHARLPQRRSARTRVDWAQLDPSICERVTQAARRIRDQHPLRRVTKGLCARLAGVPHLERRLGKLPRTRDQLTALCESVEQFQARRLLTLAPQSAARGGALHRWRLLRVAGIPECRVTPRVEDVLLALGCGRP